MVHQRMMTNSQKVFVDTLARIALINTNDNLAAKAKQILVRLKQQQVILVTTEFILLEVADA